MCRVSQLLSLKRSRVIVTLFHCLDALVEVLAVMVGTCRSLPSKGPALPPVVVATVKLSELSSEMRQ